MLFTKGSGRFTAARRARADDSTFDSQLVWIFTLCLWHWPDRCCVDPAGHTIRGVDIGNERVGRQRIPRRTGQRRWWGCASRLQVFSSGHLQSRRSVQLLARCATLWTATGRRPWWRLPGRLPRRRQKWRLSGRRQEWRISGWWSEQLARGARRRRQRRREIPGKLWP